MCLRVIFLWLFPVFLDLAFPLCRGLRALTALRYSVPVFHSLLLFAFPAGALSRFV